ncbi:MAG: ABC transporter permease, partial [Clostridia bacterium]|nr:ABC transporter permease [Clostridia bacterium]
MASKVDSTIEDLRDIAGLHIVVNKCNGTDLYVYDQLLDWDEEGCSDSEFSLVQRSPDGIRTFWHQVFADKAYFEVFGVPRLDSGRFFSDEEFKLTYEEGTVVPVVLGYDFKKYCKIGDTFEANVLIGTEELVTIEVVGFAADGNVYLDINGNKLNNMNRVAVLPMNYMRLEQCPKQVFENWGECSEMFGNTCRYLMLLVEKERKDEVIDQMNEVLRKYDLDEKLYFKKPNTDTVTIANNYKENMDIRLALTYITVFFSFVSVILITVNRISSNIRNYAIHLISGGTFGNIYSYVVGEICIFTLLGFILGSNAYGIRNIITNYVNTMPAESEYGFYAGWIICLVMLLLFALISLIIVVIRLKHTDLSSVIRDKKQSGGSRGRIYKIITVTAFTVISFCIIFAVSYYVHINSVDMYYRHFYTEHTKKIDVFNDLSIGEDVVLNPQYKGLAEDYVIDKFVSIMYSDTAPYIRGTYYEGNVALPDILEG